MKACPVCHRLYALGAGFCQADGTALVSAGKVEIARDPRDERVGSVLLGRYRVFRVVADGGMARVYEALDESQQRSVALKILHREVRDDPITVERFQREFQVGSELGHPHIVEVLDFRRAVDGSQVLVTEFLHGEELRSLLRREGGISIERAVRMLSQAALALDFAHARGWVHRDLKPENLFLCQTAEGDVLKILDFGSVKDKSDGAKPLTVLGTTIGSPFYMSPEQAQGLASVDGRTDVWALAVVLYEALSGQVPFQGPNGPSILMQILLAVPEPISKLTTARGLTLPASVDDVLSRALAKDPATRTSSVGQFAGELGQACGLVGTHTMWAATAQNELARALQRIPASGAPALVHQPSPRAPSAMRAPAPVQARVAPLASEPDIVARRTPRWMLWLGCLALGFLVALLVALTR